MWAVELIQGLSFSFKYTKIFRREILHWLGQCQNYLPFTVGHNLENTTCIQHCLSGVPFLPTAVKKVGCTHDLPATTGQKMTIWPLKKIKQSKKERKSNALGSICGTGLSNQLQSHVTNANFQYFVNLTWVSASKQWSNVPFPLSYHIF